MEIEPIERLILDGLTQKFARTFDCKPMITSAYEKMRLLKDRNANGQLVYPMAFLKISSMSAATDRYTSPYMARTGIQVVASDDNNSAIAVKILPMNFQIDVEYRTNSFDLSVDTSVLAFARKWMFARRNGKLKFNIKYGKAAILVSAVLDETVPVPDKASVTEQVPEYIINTSMVLQGWVSEPQTKIIGTVQAVKVDAALSNSTNYWAFSSGEQI